MLQTSLSKLTSVFQVERTSQGEFVVVLAYGVAGNVLPISREHDYDAKAKASGGHSKYYGEPLRKQYDAHYAQLDTSSATECVLRVCLLVYCLLQL